MRRRIAVWGLMATLAMAGAAQAGPLGQNVMRNLGWWYGPGYHAYNNCPGYPARCWAYCPTTFPAPVPLGVALPQRGACQNCLPHAYGYAGYYGGYGGYGGEIHHYPASPYQMAPGVEVIGDPTPSDASPDTYDPETMSNPPIPEAPMPGAPMPDPVPDVVAPPQPQPDKN